MVKKLIELSQMTIPG